VRKSRKLGVRPGCSIIRIAWVRRGKEFDQSQLIPLLPSRSTYSHDGLALVLEKTACISHFSDRSAGDRKNLWIGLHEQIEMNAHRALSVCVKSTLNFLIHEAVRLDVDVVPSVFI
jgi:hypothetical protein